MKKSILLDFVANRATPEQQKQVLDWADKCETNMQYLIDLKLHYVHATLPDIHTSEMDMKKMESSILGIDTTNDDINSQRQQTHNTKLKLIATKKYIITNIISVAVAAIAIIALILKPSANSITSTDQMQTKILAKIKDEQIRVQLNDIPKQYLNTVYTEKGVKSIVVLPDSSIIQLNSDTKLSYPAKFIGSTRELRLSGEAYFKVKSDPSKPMIITTNKDFIIKVLGTEFNIKSYDNDNIAQATLYSGKIDFITSNSVLSLKPNEQIEINSKKELKLLYPPILSDTKAWTEGRIVFEETSLSEVIKTLERWHGVKIIVKDPKILNYKITANFNSESIYQIMFIIKNCALLDYSIKDNIVTIFTR